MSFTAQMTLTEDVPLILDATCSDKKIWPRAASIRMDIRREVNPDIVASAGCLPFRDNIFWQIYCDPPHLIQKKDFVPFAHSPWFASVNRNLIPRMMGEKFRHNLKRFGRWKSYEEWLNFIKATNEEFSRVLNPFGNLRYKICEVKGNRKVSVKDLGLMDNFYIQTYRKTKSNSGNPTYWLTMKLNAPGWK